MTKKRGLGRDLQALLGNLSRQDFSEPEMNKIIDGNLSQLPLAKIQAGKYQPRKSFSEDSLKELADSIRSQGVIQPIVIHSILRFYIEKNIILIHLQQRHILLRFFCYI